MAGTAHLWLAAWCIALLGKEKLIRGRSNVTEEGRRLNVAMHWPREREGQILREGRWLERLLGWRVESWRELVDAIDWNWVLNKVEELAVTLKPWIGPESADDAEREGLVRRMLGELALLVHFAEARGCGRRRVEREEGQEAGLGGGGAERWEDSRRIRREAGPGDHPLRRGA